MYYGIGIKYRVNVKLLKHRETGVSNNKKVQIFLSKPLENHYALMLFQIRIFLVMTLKYKNSVDLPTFLILFRIYWGSSRLTIEFLTETLSFNRQTFVLYSADPSQIKLHSIKKNKDLFSIIDRQTPFLLSSQRKLT